MSSQKLNHKQVKQALYLLKFDFTLKHILDNSIRRANSLSKHLDQQVEIKRNNKNRILEKKK